MVVTWTTLPRRTVDLSFKGRTFAGVLLRDGEWYICMSEEVRRQLNRIARYRILPVTISFGLPSIPMSTESFTVSC